MHVWRFYIIDSIKVYYLCLVYAYKFDVLFVFSFETSSDMDLQGTGWLRKTQNLR